MRTPQLTLYYDSNCPLCDLEIQRLSKWDKQQCLAYIDIMAPDFKNDLPGVSFADLDAAIHSRTADGKVLVGIDTFILAYTLVGKRWLVSPLTVQWLRPFWLAAYRWFAKNRNPLSRLLGYRQVPVCDGNVCEKKTIWGWSTRGNPH
ncbi:DUF393 domain-containing protein [Leeia sp. TBRC 13508]|uniref:DUF393 domain-containing protein n=1 Tax=Leeia speluncae TaxID=2884804 RepID=A0ABS8D409_9NEIS|nr:DUF393 domain-containing protein [Leeia speluncae]MCB6182939.1 DUF393 domain-containing protein [Leeia speluncae]